MKNVEKLKIINNNMEKIAIIIRNKRIMRNRHEKMLTSMIRSTETHKYSITGTNYKNDNLIT